MTWDCIVLGLGGFGSAAAYHLARRGARVLGIEQHAPAHDLGSSHGDVRITRQAYFEHPDYVPLLRQSFTGWRELEAETGRSLLTICGLFLCGPPEGETIRGTLRAAKEHRLPLEQLTPAEASDRFPSFSFPDGTSILFERQAGYLRVEDCVRSHLDAARRHGATLRFHEFVERWTAIPNGVKVFTDRGTYEAGRLIVTAGPWASRMLRDLDVPLRVLRKVQLWFAAPSRAYDDAPCFLYETPRGDFYGFPSIDGRTIKVAEHSGGELVDDSALVDRRCRPADVEPVARFITESLPRASTNLLRHSVCLYTMSPDSHFLIDRHPKHPHVSFGAGFSGHGFKFTNILGRALADLASDEKAALPIGFLGLGRFRGKG